eukprot:COSAG01_NODE_220_length_21453_cov_118.998361_12_plen_110_part_00
MRKTDHQNRDPEPPAIACDQSELPASAGSSVRSRTPISVRLCFWLPNWSPHLKPIQRRSCALGQPLLVYDGWVRARGRRRGRGAGCLLIAHLTLRTSPGGGPLAAGPSL